MDNDHTIQNYTQRCYENPEYLNIRVNTEYVFSRPQREIAE